MDVEKNFMVTSKDLPVEYGECIIKFLPHGFGPLIVLNKKLFNDKDYTELKDIWNNDVSPRYKNGYNSPNQVENTVEIIESLEKKFDDIKMMGSTRALRVMMKLLLASNVKYPAKVREMLAKKKLDRIMSSDEVEDFQRDYIKQVVDYQEGKNVPKKEDMICDSCDGVIEDGDKFCIKCGMATQLSLK